MHATYIILNLLVAALKKRMVYTFQLENIFYIFGWNTLWTSLWYVQIFNIYEIFYIIFFIVNLHNLLWVLYSTLQYTQAKFQVLNRHMKLLYWRVQYSSMTASSIARKTTTDSYLVLSLYSCQPPPATTYFYELVRN